MKQIKKGGTKGEKIKRAERRRQGWEKGGEDEVEVKRIKQGRVRVEKKVKEDEESDEGERRWGGVGRDGKKGKGVGEGGENGKGIDHGRGGE